MEDHQNIIMKTDKKHNIPMLASGKSIRHLATNKVIKKRQGERGPDRYKRFNAGYKLRWERYRGEKARKLKEKRDNIPKRFEELVVNRMSQVSSATHNNNTYNRIAESPAHNNNTYKPAIQQEEVTPKSIKKKQRRFKPI